MSHCGKVIWTEGLMLGQQHLQQMERYQAYQNKFENKYLHENRWGIASFDYDKTALERGEVFIHALTVKLASGLWVEYKQMDYVLSLKLNAKQNKTNIYFAIAKNNLAAPLSGYLEQPSLFKWVVSYENIKDIYDHRLEKEVPIGFVKAKLLTDDHCLDEFEIIKLAEITKDRFGKWQFDDNYIPPVLSIKSIDYFYKKMIMLHNKVKLILQNIEENSSNICSDIKTQTNYIYLLEACTKLKRYLYFCQATPEDIVSVFYELIAKLEDNQKDSKLEYLYYDHENISGVLNFINDWLSNYKIQQTHKVLNFSKDESNKNIYHCKNYLLSHAKHFILEINCKYAQDNLQEYIKISATESIENLITSATTGIKTSLLNNQYHTAPSYQYFFFLQKEGSDWQRVVETQTISVFITNHILPEKIRLIAYE